MAPENNKDIMRFDTISYSGHLSKALKQFYIAENSYFKPVKKDVVNTGDLMYVTKGGINKVSLKVINNVAYVGYLSFFELIEETPVMFLVQDESGLVYFLTGGGIYTI